MHLRFKDGKPKALTLSYDDCVVQDMRLMEILNKYGLKCTFHICTGLYFPEGRKRERFEGQMSLSEAQNLYTGSGHEVACHVFRHERLDLIESEEEIRELVLRDRKNVEAQYGKIARGMAYPCGAYNDRVLSALKKCGLSYSRVSDSSFGFGLPKDWLRLAPTLRHGLTDKLWELTEKFTTEKVKSEDGWWFLLRGHSYEFDKDDNWELIEEFAKKTGFKDDIWYATTIEVYDYVKAYESLQKSADEGGVFNPSHLDLWIEREGRIHKVKSGQTVWF